MKKGQRVYFIRTDGLTHCKDLCLDTIETTIMEENEKCFLTKKYEVELPISEYRTYWDTNRKRLLDYWKKRNTYISL